MLPNIQGVMRDGNSDLSHSRLRMGMQHVKPVRRMHIDCEKQAFKSLRTISAHCHGEASNRTQLTCTTAIVVLSLLLV